MRTPRCIDWGILGDCGEAERARALLGEDTPWTRLFDLAELPTYRLITVEFLSTFQYRAHQAAVRVEEDAEHPPDIEFSLGGQHFKMSIERFAVHLGLYYEPETVLDDFGQELTQGEEGVMRAYRSINSRIKRISLGQDGPYWAVRPVAQNVLLISRNSMECLSELETGRTAQYDPY
ncbi:hypothetical protein R6Q57_016899 [Mikania cordata]